MAYVSSAERIGYARGMLQGIADGTVKGIQEGMQQGMQQGKLEGEIVLLKSLLEYKFGTLDSGYQRQLEQANPSHLLLWAKRVLTAETIVEVFA